MHATIGSCLVVGRIRALIAFRGFVGRNKESSDAVLMLAAIAASRVVDVEILFSEGPSERRRKGSLFRAA
jgi:hypothetical protein